MDLNLRRRALPMRRLRLRALPLAFFDLEHAREPGFVADLLGLRQQAVEVQALEARPQRLKRGDRLGRVRSRASGMRSWESLRVSCS